MIYHATRRKLQPNLNIHGHLICIAENILTAEESMKVLEISHNYKETNKTINNFMPANLSFDQGLFFYFLE